MFMKKILFITCVLFLSANSFADTTCNNTKHPLDELRYMDVDELNMNYCVATKFQSLYTRMLSLGDFSYMDAVSVCGKVTDLTKKVLKKEYGEEVPDCMALYPSMMKD